ncbi:hypothetical protein MPTK1_1g01540 [Marchantia polymorpha subsp. ruderalis]|uniref:Light-regulated protein n=2 Tax=Marchantia polymorpha TaxID=3197 RepID=A0AAF6AKE7_MARPO|nr:hypothetical protein MARPO_0029s0093 [Marchantia polymorpha]BBM96917.1 hypothetical protein Mp_1g01540 [Marchantia polymorpha subsp. ruderalis]|eukprot:PTQ42566.1 hypothetical protein MARPO_0029s0093 [Marchantia polymorpha]
MQPAAMSIVCGNPTVCAAAASPSIAAPKHGVSTRRTSLAHVRANTRFPTLKVQAQPAEQELTFNYEGQKTTVFPAEACDELGEEYCGMEGVGKEVKPKAQAISEEKPSSEAGVDREYEEYKGDKTVFPGEACDELGGEFCDPEYQKDVFPEKK